MKINQSYIQFFMELAPNNHKTWFDANKSRYQNDIKAPFEALVEELIMKLKKSDDLGDLQAKDCIFRINKDVRFSKDKTPYKTQMSALITKGGKKEMTRPGLYFEIGPEETNIYSGVYMPDKNQLEAIRDLILKQQTKFNKIIADKDFIKNFKEIKGDKSKIIAPKYKAIVDQQPLILNKQFYITHQIETQKLIKKDMADYIVEVYKTAKEFNQFLLQAF